MVLYEMSIDDIDHTVLINSGKKETYFRLTGALMSGISDADQSRITNLNRHKRKIMYFSDIVGCYEGIKFLGTTEMISCICGKTGIIDNYVIRNKTTGEELIVGSTCALNWFKADKIGDVCKYCKRNNKSRANCINCSAKTNLKSVLLTWKNRTKQDKEMVSFGTRYNGILTYKELCGNIRYRGYVNWCINQSNLKESIKDKLRHFVMRQ